MVKKVKERERGWDRSLWEEPQGLQKVAAWYKGEVFIRQTVKRQTDGCGVNCKGTEAQSCLAINGLIARRQSWMVIAVRILSLPTVCLTWDYRYRGIAVIQNAICFNILRTKISLELVPPKAFVWLSADGVQKAGASYRVPMLCCSRSDSWGAPGTPISLKPHLFQGWDGRNPCKMSLPICTEQSTKSS